MAAAAQLLLWKFVNSPSLLVIKKHQIEAFKVPIRKQKRDQMLLQLMSNGYNAKEGEGKDLIIEDSRGNKTRLVFDENYNAKKIVKPSGLEYGFTFDGDDNLTKFSFPGNESIGFGYDGQLLKNILLNQDKITLNYDDKNRIAEVVSPDDKKYKIAYNISAQVESITNRANEVKRFETAIKDNHFIHSIKDSLGRVTKIETDPQGTGDKIFFPDGTSETTAYDENLEAFVTKLRNGNKMVTYYEGMNPARVEWQDGNFLNLKLDDKQQVQEIENPAGTVCFEYDDKGAVSSEAFQGNKVRYNYDKDGLLAEMVYPSGLSVKYVYDADGRLQAMNAGGNVCAFRYGANDTVAEVHYPNGMIEKRLEKVLGGLQESTIVNDKNEVLSQEAYRYDNLCRLANYRSFDRDNPSPKKEWHLAYDDEGRLVTSVESIAQKVEKFDYDQKGNFTAINGSPVTMGSMDETLSVGGSGVQYDRNGNVKSFAIANGNRVELNFNDSNQLKFAKTSTGVWEYWYDGLGRRVGKSNGKDAHKFFWASEKLLTEEVKTGNEVVFREYIYGASTTVPVAFRENGQLFWLHSDMRGAVVKVFDNQGQAVWSADYAAFGEANVGLDNIRQPWRLAGQYFDGETGLHYNKARYYSPFLKSFLSLDRLWSQHEATNYSYGVNDPYNRVDVDGNRPEWVNTAASIGAGLVVGIAAAAIFAIAAPALGGGLLAAVLIGAASGGVGGIVEDIVARKMAGENFCIPCSLGSKSALYGMGGGAILGGLFHKLAGPLGALLGRVLKPVAAKISGLIAKMTGKAAKEAAEKLAKETADNLAQEAAKKVAKEASKHTFNGHVFDKASSPIKIPANAKVTEQLKEGYTQVKYNWTENGVKYESRWHTRTPGAPAQQGNTWVVTKTTPGNGQGIQKVEHILVEDQWTSMQAWQNAIKANKAGTATELQKQILESGHHPAF